MWVLARISNNSATPAIAKLLARAIVGDDGGVKRTASSIVLGSILLVVGLLVVGAPTARGALRPRDADRIEARYDVLFVGNSYTRFHGLPFIVRSLLRSLPSAPEVRVDVLARPGWTLARHLARRGTERRIASGSFTHVVLQGHSLSAFEEGDAFRRSVAALVDATRRAGARPVLYETWARRAGARRYRRGPALGGRVLGDPELMFARIDATYAALARELDSPLAPAGRAFAIAEREHTRLPLYSRDGSHPSLHGSYLAAVTLSAVVSGRDPRSFSYAPHPLSRADAGALRELAARALRAPR